MTPAWGRDSCAMAWPYKSFCARALEGGRGVTIVYFWSDSTLIVIVLRGYNAAFLCHC